MTRPTSPDRQGKRIGRGGSTCDNRRARDPSPSPDHRESPTMPESRKRPKIRTIAGLAGCALVTSLLLSSIDRPAAALPGPRATDDKPRSGGSSTLESRLHPIIEAHDLLGDDVQLPA